MNVYDFTADRIDGQPESLSIYKGKVLLIVNTASRCGFTPQYKGLQDLYDKYRAQEFEVLGFPCNQFGSQEPGDNAEIQSFCGVTYGVRFPLFAKIDVNGASTHPLFAYLKENAKGTLGTKRIKWNFTKFLVDRHGDVVQRFAPNTTPPHMEAAIEERFV